MLRTKDMYDTFYHGGHSKFENIMKKLLDNPIIEVLNDCNFKYNWQPSLKMLSIFTH